MADVTDAETEASSSCLLLAHNGASRSVRACLPKKLMRARRSRCSRRGGVANCLDCVAADHAL